MLSTIYSYLWGADTQEENIPNSETVPNPFREETEESSEGEYGSDIPEQDTRSTLLIGDKVFSVNAKNHHDKNHKLKNIPDDESENGEDWVHVKNYTVEALSDNDTVPSLLSEDEAIPVPPKMTGALPGLPYVPKPVIESKGSRKRLLVSRDCLDSSRDLNQIILPSFNPYYKLRQLKEQELSMKPSSKLRLQEKRNKARAAARCESPKKRETHQSSLYSHMPNGALSELFCQKEDKTIELKRQEKMMTRNALKMQNINMMVNSAPNKPCRRNSHYNPARFSGVVNNRKC